jgi:hypothetical protein
MPEQGLNTSKALSRLREHEGTWKTLLNFVGTRDIPGLHRIFKNAKQRGQTTAQNLYC